MIKYIIKIFCLCFLFGINFAQQNREVRAVWLTTNFQLDWPPATYNAETQKTALIKIFDNLKTRNINTVYFQVRSNGTVLFNSSYESYPLFLTGDTSKIQSYDPLKFAIELARARNIQLHAWVNVFRCLTKSDHIDRNNPKHIFNKNPEWIVIDKKNSSFWLNPGIVDARAYLVDMFSELVSKYDVDGLHLDFIRYPGTKFSDDLEYLNSFSELDIHDWRRQNIESFLKVLKIRINQIKPAVIIGAAPFGIYKKINGAVGTESYSEVYQDSKKWVDEKIIDYIVPQVYWDIENNPRFDSLAANWKNIAGEFPLILGLAPYKPEIAEEIFEQIEIARNVNANGVAFFRYQHFLSLPENIFNEYSLPLALNYHKGINANNYDLELKMDFNENESLKLKWETSILDTNAVPILNTMIYQLGKKYNSKKLILNSNEQTGLIKLSIPNPKNLNYTFKYNVLTRNWDYLPISSNIVEFTHPKIDSLLIKNLTVNRPILINKDGRIKILFHSEIEDSVIISCISAENEEVYKYELKINPGENILHVNADLELEILKLQLKSGKHYNLRIVN